MRYTKPALTFAQQADQLIARGMQGDREKMIARLSTVNYYRLSAYWYTFRVPGTETLRPGTDFDRAWDRYAFDQRLRLLTMEAIERIEVAVRTQLAYCHSHAFDGFAYATNLASLPGMTNGPEYDRRSHAYWISDIRRQVARSGDQPFVRHFQRKYTLSSDLPIWMATELMTLGNVLRLFQGCRQHERQPVANMFSVTQSELESWLMMLNNVRNICAHHGRFWNRKLVKEPKLPRHADWSQPVQIDPTTVFAALTVCGYCLVEVSPDSDWHKRVRALMEDYPDIPKRTGSRGWTMGVPENWIDCPLWSRAR
jgi:abortive infection bacteriophage resistance protein